MPEAIPRPCRHPGCPSVTTEGLFCDRHQPIYARARDRSYRQFKRNDPKYRQRRKLYNSRVWKQARRRYIANNPMCEAPGCDRIATEVDHIVPLAAGGAPLDEENFQALCKGCHSSKTRSEQSQGGL